MRTHVIEEIQVLTARSPATVLLFNKIQRTAWEVEFGPRKLAGQCS